MTDVGFAELVVTFTDEVHERACQAVEPQCSRVALWRIWMTGACKCHGGVIEYCTPCKNEVLEYIKDNASYLVHGLHCPLCGKNVGHVNSVEPVRGSHVL